MPLIKIDNRELEVEAGITVLQAAERLGIEIPRYCYHPALKIVASCRMCLVKIQGFPKLVPSCSTAVNGVPDERKVDGKYDMVVVTKDQEVRDAQESMMEFLLLNHPVDCPECDQAGECLLQDYSYRYGKSYSRFEYEKRVPPRKDMGPHVLLIATRCILCSRCVRFTQEITGTNELIVKQRGYKSEIDTFPGVSLDNKMSMNTVDICPVGALVSKDFLHKPRNWRYDKVETICPGCSVGCNIQVEYMQENNEIYRIKPVHNPDVNDWWMCDDGRLFYQKYANLKRLEFPQLRRDGALHRANWVEARKSAVENLKKQKEGSIAVVASGFASNEELFLLKKVFSEGLKVKLFAIDDNHPREEDVVYPRFTIKGEKAPNLTGAADMLNTETTFSEILKKIDSGEVKALFYLGGDPQLNMPESVLNTLKKLEYLVVQDISFNAITGMAHTVLAGASAYEKNGTFTNYKHRVQRIRQTIMPPVSAKSDYEILQEIGRMLNVEAPLRPAKMFREIAASVKGYEAMEYEKTREGGMPKTGYQVTPPEKTAIVSR
ncbi:MAG: molybdopterin-dependent oxidoreductase [Calditrichia bacterium]